MTHGKVTFDNRKYSDLWVIKKLSTTLLASDWSIRVKTLKKKNKKVQDLQCLRRLPVLVKKTRFIWLVVFHQPILNMFTHDFELPPPRNSSFPNMLLTSGRSWRWVFVPLHWTTLQVQPRVEAIGIQRDPWTYMKTYMKCLIFYGFHVRLIYHTYMDPMGNAQLNQVCDIFDAFGNARRNLMQEICLLTGIGNP